MTNYKGKVALVTGASAGIGKVYATELAAKGCHVILVARSKGKLDALASELTAAYGIRAFAIAQDLSKPEAVEALSEQIKHYGLQVNILINNAGFGTYGRFEDIPNEREQEEIALNIASLVAMNHQFLPDMQRRGDGVIVNVASVAAFQPSPYMAVYSATKAFVLSFSEALWAENRNRGVHILALCPGATQTEFFNVVGTEAAAGGSKLASPVDVVKAGFRGVDEKRSYIIAGTQNYWTSQASRFLPRKWVARLMERIVRPRTI
ncbi:SDR family NAD(P)-dependent oxidoreductase [Paenibacillus sp. 1P07SE]|uniref:SDR family NAD(P)-dependent oxidoreductase n=1 Tax=Paenibacillus sp. 1P07SE TaxID=3132209 RepID=UPI0039A61A50